MNYIRFFRAHRNLLGFGLLTALSTSFGQTFFISLFLLQFQHDFQIGKSEFGLLYASVTLLSALLLPLAGSRIDGADLRRYSAMTLAALAVSAMLLASAASVWMLAAGLLGLRLAGQGLLGHISHTVMAREFGLHRGKALGLAGIGYPLGEALLPVACAVALRFVPWRGLWLLVGLLVAFILLPAALRLLPEQGSHGTPGSESGGDADPQQEFRRSLWRDRRFYLVLPSVLAPPFVLTGLFLYQAVLAEDKGWTAERMAGAFSAFAVARAVTSLAAGPVIDHFSASRLLPAYLLPLAAGLCVAVMGHSPMTAFAYMILAGMTAGSSGSITSAVWAELYGPANVGRARSHAASFSIFATAASPALMGWLFRAGWRMDQMLAGAAWLILAAGAASLPVSRLAGRFQDERRRAVSSGASCFQKESKVRTPSAVR